MNMVARSYKMQWFSKHNISLLLLLYLAASEMLGEYAFWIILVLSAAYYIAVHRGKLKIRSPLSTNVLFVMIAIGLWGTLFSITASGQTVKAWPFLRDIIRISTVPLTCLLCTMLSENAQKKKSVLYTTLFFFCSVYGIGSMLISIPNYMMTSQSLFNFAGNLIDQWVAAVGLFLGFCRPPCIDKYYISKKFDSVAKLGLAILVVISFSRTAFVLLLCLILPFYYNKLGKFIKTALAILIALFFVWNMFPDIASTFMNKVTRSFTEMSSSNAAWDDGSIVNNWRGYEVYCAQKQFSAYNMVEKVIGRGFGATVDANGYARLVTSEDSLPYLHNGYYTTLIKMGVAGVFFNFVYWIALYIERKKRLERYEKKNCIGLIAAMASSMLAIHGIFWGGCCLFRSCSWTGNINRFRLLL